MKISVYRLSLVKERSIPYEKADHVVTPADVHALIRACLRRADREHFIVVFLDAHCKVIGIHTVSIGTLTENLVHAREVFKGAILANAASIICAHNHPSGLAVPSEADIQLTGKLREAGKIVGIPVEDHLILAEESFFSFREQGFL